MLRVTLSFVATVAAVAATADDYDPSRWEQSMKIFEARDAKNPPVPGGTLFVGSSSIVFWKLDQSFPGKDYLNRGFGGSTYRDLVHFFDRVVLPYKPAKMVVYSGDNDVASGMSADAVFDDFTKFAMKVHESLPETQVYMLPAKPSEARWELWPVMRDFNAKLAAYCKEHLNFHCVDITACLLGDDGKPDPSLFLSDKLHLNPDGYEKWTAIVKPWLQPTPASARTP